MRRDPELVRKILLEAEKVDRGPKPIHVDGYSEAEITYHGKLLVEAGWINESPVDGGFFVRHLTAAGHEAVDVIRADTAWRKIKLASAGAAGVVGRMSIIALIQRAIAGE